MLGKCVFRYRGIEGSNPFLSAADVGIIFIYLASKFQIDSINKYITN